MVRGRGRQRGIVVAASWRTARADDRRQRRHPLLHDLEQRRAAPSTQLQRCSRRSGLLEAPLCCSSRWCVHATLTHKGSRTRSYTHRGPSIRRRAHVTLPATQTANSTLAHPPRMRAVWVVRRASGTPRMGVRGSWRAAGGGAPLTGAAGCELFTRHARSPSHPQSGCGHHACAHTHPSCPCALPPPLAWRGVLCRLLMEILLAVCTCRPRSTSWGPDGAQRRCWAHAGVDCPSPLPWRCCVLLTTLQHLLRPLYLKAL